MGEPESRGGEPQRAAPGVSSDTGLSAPTAAGPPPLPAPAIPPSEFESLSMMDRCHEHKMDHKMCV